MKIYKNKSVKKDSQTGNGNHKEFTDWYVEYQNAFLNLVYNLNNVTLHKMRLPENDSNKHKETTII